MMMSPEVGRSMPLIMFSRVDFPEPLGPRRTENAVSGISAVMPSRTERNPLPSG